MKSFDAIVIGAGQAGPPLAGRLTGAGQTVALVERKLLGGTCVNVGCMPTKTQVASAYAAQLARRGAEYGVVLDGAVRVDMAKVKARTDAVVQKARSGVAKWLAGMKGLTLVEGHARFESPDRVRVGDEVLSAPRIFINVGTRPSVPAIPGVERVPFLNNRTMLELDRVPEHLLVIGGSYIGLEFAQIHRRFGARVTVIEMAKHLIAREDPDVSEAIRGILEAEDIEVRTSATCIRLEPHAAGAAVTVDCANGPPAVSGSHVLLAVGRRPNTDDLGLESAGVVTDAKGYVTVDDGLATSVPGIWALGDCNGRGAFTHTSWNDYEIVAANLLDGAARRVSQRVLAYALYIDPPLGRVGQTETQARAAGRPLLVGTRPMTRVGRAVEKGETQGFMKIVADRETRKILGASILGTGGDEAIHGLVDAMSAGIDVDGMIRAVPIHPTVSELIPTVLGEMKPV
jgi:pyruvate/2-oxoglutarate dehydrogenase complex dihydrolipoamide dehydrogenase (E3) component